MLPFVHAPPSENRHREGVRGSAREGTEWSQWVRFRIEPGGIDRKLGGD